MEIRNGQAVVGRGDLERLIALIEAMISMVDGDPGILCTARGARFSIEATTFTELRTDIGSGPYSEIEDLTMAVYQPDASEAGVRRVSARMGVDGDVWRVDFTAEALDAQTADRALQQLRESIIAFGGPAPASAVSEDGSVPRRIERSHEPIEWGSWAATREQFACLVVNVADLVRKESGDSDITIRVPGFDSYFKSAEEFLFNVDEGVWRERRTANLFVRASGSSLAELTTSIRTGKYSVVLEVDGGTRTERNSILPELRELVARYERPPDSFRWRGAIGAAPWITLAAVSAGIFAAGLAIGGFLGGFIGLGVAFVLSMLTTFLAERVDSAVREATPNVEFLGDDGEPAWSRVLDGVGKASRRLGSAILLLAAVATILGLFHVI